MTVPPVLRAERLNMRFGALEVARDIDFALAPGARHALIGPNGAGKTTFFRMIVGQEQPDGGALRLGETVVLGYIDQSRDALAPEMTVWQEISEEQDIIEVGKRSVPSRAYVAAFNFRGADQQKR